MIPILYEALTTNYAGNGLGRLTDCIRCLVTEERNGSYEVEFDYPITGVHYSEIMEGRIVYTTHDNSGECQPFTIYAKSAPLNGVVTFNAHHVSYALSNVILKPLTASSVTSAMAKLETDVLTDNPFTFYTDKSTTATFTVKTPTSIRSVLGGIKGSILDAYGGEYEFDNYTVKLLNNRGANNGVTIRYGKNLTKLTQTYSVLDKYNAIVAYWQDTEGNVVYANPVVVRDGTRYTNDWTDENSNYMTDESNNVLEFEFSPTRCVAIDFSTSFTTKPTKAQLQAKAASYLANNTPWLPNENIKFDFVSMWASGEAETGTTEYLTDMNGNYIYDENGARIALIHNVAVPDVAQLESVRLCDTVSVIYTALGVSATAKVIKTVWNPLLDRYDSLEMGDAKTSFAETIVTETKEVLKEYPTTTAMEEAIGAATSLITGGMGGHVVFQYDANGKPTEIYVMDTEDVNTAVHVLRINVNGIGFSSTGVNGSYTTAWTLDGNFVADFITTGTLTANLIRAGVLASADGTSYWDLDASEFRFYDDRYDSYVGLDEGYIEFGHDGQVFGRLIRMIQNSKDVLALQTNNINKRITLGPDEIGAAFDPHYIRLSELGMNARINGTTTINAYDSDEYQYCAINSGGNTWARVDGKDDYIRLNCGDFIMNGYYAYEGNVTIGDVTLHIHKGIITQVDN